MSLGHVKRPLAIGATLILLAAGIAHGQDGTVPIPDSSYGAGPNYQSPTDLPMPAPDDLTNPDIVTIPIPGGGDVTVDGPDAPRESNLPNLPGSQWGVSQQNLYSHDIGPNGP
ncbi:MAG: hypothetical protein ACREQH_15330 [Candidatus Binatus sp.]